MSPTDSGPLFGLQHPYGLYEVWLDLKAKRALEQQHINVDVHGKHLLLARAPLYVFREDLPMMHKMRYFALWVTESRRFERTTFIVILVNCVLMVLPVAYDPDSVTQLDRDLFFACNVATMILFTTECILKIIARGLFFGNAPEHCYLRDPLNWLDLAVVGASWLELAVQNVSSDSNAVFVVRILRVLRPLKTIQAFPGLQDILCSLADSTPLLGHWLFVAGLCFSIVTTFGMNATFGLTYFQRCRLDPAPSPVNGTDGGVEWPTDSAQPRFCGGRHSCRPTADGQPTYCASPVNFNGPLEGFDARSELSENPGADFGWTGFHSFGAGLLTVIEVSSTERWTDLLYRHQDGAGTFAAVVFFCMIVTFGGLVILTLVQAIFWECFGEIHRNHGPARKRSATQSGIPQDILSMKLQDLVRECTLQTKKRKQTQVEEQVQARTGIGLKSMCLYICSRPLFENFFLVLVIVNAAILSFDRYPSGNPTALLVFDKINLVCSFLFIFEVVIKLIGLGINFFGSQMNLFDFVLVALSGFEIFQNGTGSVSALRTARLLRVFNCEVFRVNVAIRVLMRMLKKVIAPIYSLTVIVLIYLFCMTLLALQLFFPRNNEQSNPPKASFPRFDTQLWAFVSVFVMLTGADWSKNLITHLQAMSQTPLTIITFHFVVMVSRFSLAGILLGIYASSFAETREEMLQDFRRKLAELRHPPPPPPEVEPSSPVMQSEMEEPKSPMWPKDVVQCRLAPHKTRARGMNLLRMMQIKQAAAKRKDMAHDFLKSRSSSVVRNSVRFPDTEAREVPVVFRVDALHRAAPPTPPAAASSEGTTSGRLPGAPLSTATAAQDADALPATDQEGHTEMPSRVRTAAAGLPARPLELRRPSIQPLQLEPQTAGAAPGDTGLRQRLYARKGASPSFLELVQLAREAEPGAALPRPPRARLRQPLAAEVANAVDECREPEHGNRESVAELVKQKLVALKVDSHRFLGELRSVRRSEEPQSHRQVDAELPSQPPHDCIAAGSHAVPPPPTAAKGELEQQVVSAMPNSKWRSGWLDQELPTQASGAPPERKLSPSLSQVGPEAEPSIDSVQDKLSEQQMRSWGLACPERYVSRAKQVASSPIFEVLILVLIIISSIPLVLDSPYSEHSQPIKDLFRVIEIVVLPVFVAEMLIKMAAFGFCTSPDGLHPGYFCTGWNWFDFIAVVAGVTDVCLSATTKDGSLKASRSLRVIRLMRPFGYLKHLRGINILIEAIVTALPTVLNLVVITMFFYLGFGILMVNLLKGELWHCSLDPTGEHRPDISTKDDCLAFGGAWVNAPSNFDHIGNSMVTLLHISTGEGWVDVMNTVVNSVGVNQQPRPGARTELALMVIGFVAVSNFVLVNLTVGALVDSYLLAKYTFDEVELLSWNERRWVVIQRRIFFNSSLSLPPEAKCKGTWCLSFRKGLMSAVDSMTFKVCVMLCILGNAALTCAIYPLQSTSWRRACQAASVVFTLLNCTEIALKIFVFLLDYFKDVWNRFAFLVCIGSVISVISDFIDSGHAVSRYLRIVRLLRMLHLTEQANFQGCLLSAVEAAVPALGRVAVALTLILTMFACLGVQLFGTVSYGDELGPDANFHRFPSAFLLLIRVATGGRWHSLMYDVSNSQSGCTTAPQSSQELERDGPKGCGLPFSGFAYFLVAMMVCRVGMQLFTTVVFESFYEAREKDSLRFLESQLIRLAKAWRHLDKPFRGYLRLDSVVQLLLEIPEPVGFGRTGNKRKHVLHQMRSLRIFPGRTVSFRELVILCARRSYLWQMRESEKNLDAVKFEEETLERWTGEIKPWESPLLKRLSSLGSLSSGGSMSSDDSMSHFNRQLQALSATSDGKHELTVGHVIVATNLSSFCNRKRSQWAENIAARRRAPPRTGIHKVVRDRPTEEGRALKVTITSAHGLQESDFSGSTPGSFCQCSIRGHPAQLFHTPVAPGSEPVWNFEGELANFIQGDAVEFVLCDDNLGMEGQKTLGTALLKSNDFYPAGFEGDLRLAGVQGERDVFLRVRIAVAAGKAKKTNVDVASSGEASGLNVLVTQVLPPAPAKTQKLSPLPWPPPLPQWAPL